MLIASIYLAARPERHREGAADFFLPSARNKFLRAVEGVGIVLEEWILGQLVLMVTVGVLVTFAVWFDRTAKSVPAGLCCRPDRSHSLSGPLDRCGSRAARRPDGVK